jgi:TolB-like protein
MIYRFEYFELDPQLRELRKDGAAVDLEPQVFDLLLYLVGNAEHVVSKDELFEHVWAGRVVSDSTLSSRVNAARRAIDDDGNQQRLVRTVPRRGFRFIGALERGKNDVSPGQIMPSPGAQKTGGARSGIDPELDNPDRPTIGVLPFKNLSGDPDQEFFSDGIAEDIISALSRFRLFFVIARNTSFAYKGQDPDIQSVAEELGIEYVVEGSVRKAGNRIRVSAQLNNTKTNQQIWSDHYDRDLTDMFAIQDEITQSIVNNVAPELLSVEMERARRQVTPTLDTWSRVMRAHELLIHFDKKSNVEARKLLEEAIRHDPNSSLAFADIAFLHWTNITFSWADDIPAAIEAVKVNAQKAVELDGRDPWARCMYALSKLYSGPDYDAALRGLETALEENPNMAFAHTCLGWIGALSGDLGRAASHSELAIRHSPRDPLVSLFWAANGYLAVAQDDLEKAIECGRRSIECVPPFVGGYRILAAALAMSGRVDEARQVGSELMSRTPDMTLDIVRVQQPWKDKRRMSDFIEALRAAGIPD